MTRLHDELRRLYLCELASVPAQVPAPAHPTDGDLFNGQGQTRAMVLQLAGPADWRTLSAVWTGVQADLGLPAPAIAVNGSDGLQLWFSVQQPLALEQAQAFVQGLHRRYLADVGAQRITLRPGPALQHARLVPAEQGRTGLWSAFVAPDLAAVMNDEPWLDLPPNSEGQAALLASLRSMPLPDVLAALQCMLPAPAPAPSAVAVAVAVSAVPAGGTSVPATASAQNDPHSFLLGVMNDPSAPLALRVEAAKALLGRSPDSADRRALLAR